MPGARKCPKVFVVALVLAWVVVAANPAQAQFNALSVSAGPAFPTSVQVGAQNQPALISFTNSSLGTIATVPVTVTNIRLNPSCSSSVGGFPEPCPVPEPRSLSAPILSVDPVASGRAGTACAGILFAVSPPSGTGTVTLTPSAPVVLGPSAVGGPQAQCVIDMTFDVIQRPLDGSTIAVMAAEATAPNPAIPGGVIGPSPQTGASSNIVINAAPSTITTQASPSTGVPGMVFSDTATVTECAVRPAAHGKRDLHPLS